MDATRQSVWVYMNKHAVQIEGHDTEATLTMTLLWEQSMIQPITTVISSDQLYEYFV